MRLKAIYLLIFCIILSCKTEYTQEEAIAFYTKNQNRFKLLEKQLLRLDSINTYWMTGVNNYVISKKKGVKRFQSFKTKENLHNYLISVGESPFSTFNDSLRSFLVLPDGFRVTFFHCPYDFIYSTETQSVSKANQDPRVFYINANWHAKPSSMR